MRYNIIMVVIGLLLNKPANVPENGYVMLKGGPFAMQRSVIRDEKGVRLYVELMNELYLREQELSTGRRDFEQWGGADSLIFERWMGFVEEYGFFSPNDGVFARLLGRAGYERFMAGYIVMNTRWCGYYGLGMLESIERSIPRKTCTKRDLMEVFWRYLLGRARVTLSFYGVEVVLMVIPCLETKYGDVYEFTWGRFVKMMNENNACLSVMIHGVELRNGRMDWGNVTMQSVYLDKGVPEYLLGVVKTSVEKQILVTYAKNQIPKRFRIFISTEISFPTRSGFYKIYPL